MTSELLTEVRGRTLVVTFNRPHVRNAFDRALGVELGRTMDRLDADRELRVCILRGAEGTFSSGTDLRAHERGESMIVEPRGFYGFLGCGPRVPVIAAVEGSAVGGGLEIVLGCDLVVAARGATFGLPEVRHGVFPAGGVHRLPLRIPYHLAMEVGLTGRLFSAERAHALGLVNRLVPDGASLDEALVLADEIAANAPIAVQATRDAVAEASYHDSQAASWARQLEHNEAVLRSRDSKEGVAAFLAKRPPVWTGE